MGRRSCDLLISQRLRSLCQYTPGEQPKEKQYLKLNTNENPYPPSPKVKVFLDNPDDTMLRLYPDPEFRELRQVIAATNGVTPEQVFVGNGSDEVLAFIIFSFFDTDSELLMPELSYAFYEVLCGYYGVSFTKVAMTKEFGISTSDFLRSKKAGVIFPNPNAPTGLLIPVTEIKEMLRQMDAQRPVIIDEAYIAFSGQKTAVDLLADYPNLIVVRTLSKSYSLAGLRVGYALGSKEAVSALYKAKDCFNPYTVSHLGQKIAAIAVADVAYHDEVCKKVAVTRDSISSELCSAGWDVLPSCANFIFIRKAGYSGLHIYEALRAAGVLVRHFNNPEIADFVRVSIGTDSDMKLFVSKVNSLFP
jgi:histidinol-phosphate aminotransferase